MKKNKYRWREMKDEKPEVGEFILVVSKKDIYVSNLLYRMPSVFEYGGCFNNKVMVRTPLQIMQSYPGNNFAEDSMLWRKMCKLPGDE